MPKQEERTSPKSLTPFRMRLSTFPSRWRVVNLSLKRVCRQWRPGRAAMILRRITIPGGSKCTSSLLRNRSASVLGATGGKGRSIRHQTLLGDRILHRLERGESIRVAFLLDPRFQRQGSGQRGSEADIDDQSIFAQIDPQQRTEFRGGTTPGGRLRRTRAAKPPARKPRVRNT